jgi:hypothetical protein
MIDRKEQYYRQKVDEGATKKHLQALQSEITFLKNYILPIVLRSTVIEHSEFVRYAISSYDNAIQKNCNGLLIYQPIKNDYSDQPIIGIANLRQLDEFGTQGAIELHVSNMDGNGVKVRPMNLLID